MLQFALRLTERLSDDLSLEGNTDTAGLHIRCLRGQIRAPTAITDYPVAHVLVFLCVEASWHTPSPNLNWDPYSVFTDSLTN